MAPPSSSSPPHLTPQFCFSSGALNDFLRLSRATIDDSISASLNALLTPAQQGFRPAPSRSQAGRRAPSNTIPSTTCTLFLAQTLFPSWQARDQVLEYCTGVADTMQGAAVEAKGNEREVNERMDPYSARWFPEKDSGDVLRETLRNEQAVERVVRDRTWDVLRARCERGGETEGVGWEEALGQWRRSWKKR